MTATKGLELFNVANAFISSDSTFTVSSGAKEITFNATFATPEPDSAPLCSWGASALVLVIRRRRSLALNGVHTIRLRTSNSVNRSSESPAFLPATSRIVRPVAAASFAMAAAASYPIAGTSAVASISPRSN